MTKPKSTDLKKRLFLFASYDTENTIDATVLLYLDALSKLGDIIFVTDNDVPQWELDRLKKIPNILNTITKHHGEYDFGSYKRGYQWATQKDILKQYDWVYFVNDSVFGPFFDLKPILEQMEEKHSGAAYGMIGVFSTPTEIFNFPDHIQSWFIGIAATICRKPWFAKFINSVKHQESKETVVWQYEIGLSQLLVSNGIKLGRFEDKVSGLELYNGYINTLPFIKKRAINNLHSLRLLKKIVPPEMFPAVISCIERSKLYTNTFKYIWKIKLFNRITVLSWETNRNTYQYRLRILKIIPIKFLHYKDY